jgi:hypothetical protein
MGAARGTDERSGLELPGPGRVPPEPGEGVEGVRAEAHRMGLGPRAFPICPGKCQRELAP